MLSCPFIGMRTHAKSSEFPLQMQVLIMRLSQQRHLFSVISVLMSVSVAIVAKGVEIHPQEERGRDAEPEEDMAGQVQRRVKVVVVCINLAANMGVSRSSYRPVCHTQLHSECCAYFSVLWRVRLIHVRMRGGHFHFVGV